MAESDAEVRAYRVIPDLGQKSPTFVPAAERILEANARCDRIEALLDDLVASFGAHMQARARWNDPWGSVTLHFDGTSEELSKIGPKATVLASEALHHARAALDYVAHNSAWLDSGILNPSTQFPLVDTRTEWSKVSRSARLRGVSAEHLEWMEQVQPFRDVSWSHSLRRLSNSDKHRVAVNLRPYYEIEFPMDNRLEDPLGDPEWFGFDVGRRQIGLLISDHGPSDDPADASEALSTLRAIVVGVAQLTNRFLPLEGQNEIQIAAGRM